MSGGTLPTVRGPASATLSSVQPTRISVSHSLKRQTRTQNAQRWSISFVYSPMQRNFFMQFYAFLLSQRGQADTFTCTLAGNNAPQGSWASASAPVVNGAAQTGRSISLRGFYVLHPGVVKAGDLLAFAGHTKVYMAVADTNSDGSGYATVSIEPALMASPADGEAVTYSNVPFHVALVSDSSDMALASGMLAPLTINVVENY